MHYDNKHRLRYLISILLCWNWVQCSPAKAQVSGDRTLQTNTQVQFADDRWLITEGSTVGANLFHSFETFTLQAGETALFDNALNIGNIFARVTGGDRSRIDGLLQANGSANLFLLNPAGITFGPGARLQLGGSFFASTADRLLFEDGDFSATHPEVAPLLTINQPQGLQLGDTPGTIVYQGTGHNLITDDAVVQLIAGAPPTSSLTVGTGQSIVLLGGAIELNGGGIIAPQGKVDLGAVRSGVVGLNLRVSDLGTTWIDLDYSTVSAFADIRLYEQSVVDVSAPFFFLGGIRSGSIQVQANNLSLLDGSLLLNQNFGLLPGGEIKVTVANDLHIIGTDPRSNGVLRSNILNSSILGDSGDIHVNVARDLTIADAGAIAALNFGSASSGNITVRAGSVVINGVSPNNDFANSTIASLNFGEGAIGSIDLRTDRLMVLNSGTLLSSTFSIGNGNDIFVEATESISLSGFNPVSFVSSLISPATFSEGNAGSVTVRTQQLDLMNGGQISSATFAGGNAGNVQVEAQTIRMAGNETGLDAQTVIAADGGVLPPVSQIRFGFPVLTGNSGDLTITTENLRVENNAFISANNLGTGRGGTLAIEANTIFLDTGGTITAETRSGEGGNIEIAADEGIFLRRESQITTEAGGSGNGGNIGITTDLLVAVPDENSDITANAFEGNGGNIQIDAMNILGLQSQFPASPTTSDITASSMFGGSGTIRFNNPEVNVSSGLVELSTQVLDTSTQVADRCAAADGSQFTTTGNGGLPENPFDPLRSVSFWSADTGWTIEQESAITTPEIREATGWQHNGSGEVVLATNPTLELLMPSFNHSHDASSFKTAFNILQNLNQQGITLITQGNVNSALDRWQQAIYILDTLTSSSAELADFRLRVNNQTGVAVKLPARLQPELQAEMLGIRLNYVQALRIQGQYRKALSLLRPLVAELLQQPESLPLATALRQMGVLLHLTGDLIQAKTFLEASGQVSGRLNAVVETRQTLLEMGNLAWDLNEFEVAIEHYQEVAKLARSGKLDNPQLWLQSQLNQLRLLIELNQIETAIERVPALETELASTLEHLKPDRSLLYGYLNFAESLDQLQEHLNANEAHPQDLFTQLPIQLTLKRVMELADRLGDNRAKAYLFSQWGKFATKADARNNVTLVTQALNIAQQIQATDIIATTAAQLGDIYDRQGNVSEAIRAYQIAYTALQDLRSDLVAVNPELQFSFRESVEPVYRKLVSLLLNATDDDSADPVQQARLHQALEVIEALQLAELDNFFGDACLDTNPVDINQFDPQTAVIYPIFLNDRLEVILSVPDRPLKRYSVTIANIQLENTLQTLFSSLHPGYPRSLHLQATQQVYDWLIRPLEPELQAAETQTLVFVLDGFLKNLPMAVLHDGERYLIERYGIALSPGLQLLPLAAQGQQPDVFVAALTEARQGFSALPGVKDELHVIAESLKSKILLNQHFTREALKTALHHNSASIVHLATHAQFSANPEETFLLTWDNKININDLGQLFEPSRFGLAAPIDLLVMSACQTAKGDRRAALGLAGFALRSGARSTVASLWSVNDMSTADLMAEFYRQLGQAVRDSGRSITKAEALRQAQLALLNSVEYRHPYYWAAFVLVGNWL